MICRRVLRGLCLIITGAVLAGGASTAFGQRPGMGPRPGSGPSGPGAAGIPWIDVHAHLVGERGDYRGAVAAAVTAMDEAGIVKMVIMPPPHVTGHQTWDIDDVLPTLTPRARFAILGGGGLLNPMIQDTPPAAVDDGVRRRFEARAEEILKKGAAGFGEISAHHLSQTQGHPYEAVDADHPLLRLLADVAARTSMLTARTTSRS